MNVVPKLAIEQHLIQRGSSASCDDDVVAEALERFGDAPDNAGASTRDRDRVPCQLHDGASRTRREHALVWTTLKTH